MKLMHQIDLHYFSSKENTPEFWYFYLNCTTKSDIIRNYKLFKSIT